MPGGVQKKTAEYCISIGTTFVRKDCTKYGLALDSALMANTILNIAYIKCAHYLIQGKDVCL